MVKSNTTIKIKPKYMFFIAFLTVLGFAMMTFITNKQADEYTEASFENEMEKILITGYESYGALRGAVFFKVNQFISTSAKLIENTSKFNNWKSNGPIIDFNAEPHSYTLRDLGLPYTISKKAHSDTLFVEKEGFPLKFLTVRE